MLTVRRTYIERRLYGGDRGSLEYHRSKQLRRKKDRHVVALEEDADEDAYDFRVNYTRVRGTFLDPGDNASPGAASGDGSTSSICTDVSEVDGVGVGQLKGSASSFATETSRSAASAREEVKSEEVDEPLDIALNWRYLRDELGCANNRVLRDSKLLDQFLLMKAIIDGSLPKLLFTDIMIFQHICQDVFSEIESPALTNRLKVAEAVELQMEKSDLVGFDEMV